MIRRVVRRLSAGGQQRIISSTHSWTDHVVIGLAWRVMNNGTANNLPDRQRQPSLAVTGVAVRQVRLARMFRVGGTAEYLLGETAHLLGG